MLTKMSNTNVISGYLDPQIRQVSNSVNNLDSFVPSSKNENKNEDDVTISTEAKKLSNTYDEKERTLEETYSNEAKVLEREYLQEKKRLEREYSQKKQSLGISIFA